MIKDSAKTYLHNIQMILDLKHLDCCTKNKIKESIFKSIFFYLKNIVNCNLPHRSILHYRNRT